MNPAPPEIIPASLMGHGTPAILAKTTIDWEYNTDLRVKSERFTTPVGTPAYDTRSPISYNNDGQVTCVQRDFGGSCVSTSPDAEEIRYDNATVSLTGTTMDAITDAYSYNQFGELAEYEAKFTSPNPDQTLYKVTYDSSSHPRDYLGRVKRKTEVRNGVTRNI